MTDDRSTPAVEPGLSAQRPLAAAAPLAVFRSSTTTTNRAVLQHMYSVERQTSQSPPRAAAAPAATSPPPGLHHLYENEAAACVVRKRQSRSVDDLASSDYMRMSGDSAADRPTSGGGTRTSGMSDDAATSGRTGLYSYARNFDLEPLLMMVSTPAAAGQLNASTRANHSPMLLDGVSARAQNTSTTSSRLQQQQLRKTSSIPTLLQDDVTSSRRHHGNGDATNSSRDHDYYVPSDAAGLDEGTMNVSPSHDPSPPPLPATAGVNHNSAPNFNPNRHNSSPSRSTAGVNPNPNSPPNFNPSRQNSSPSRSTGGGVRLSADTQASASPAVVSEYEEIAGSPAARDSILSADDATSPRSAQSASPSSSVMSPSAAAAAVSVSSASPELVSPIAGISMTTRSRVFTRQK